MESEGSLLVYGFVSGIDKRLNSRSLFECDFTNRRCIAHEAAFRFRWGLSRLGSGIIPPVGKQHEYEHVVKDELRVVDIISEMSKAKQCRR